MALHFVHKPDIRLKNPPLSEVICQVRFPSIFRILTENPVDFQERIRDRFPVPEVEQEIEFRRPGSVSDENPDAKPQRLTYRFRTKDDVTVISLAVNFFALSTNHYSHWHEFADNLNFGIIATQDVYKPVFSTRTGLRFINRFTLKNTGMESFEKIYEFFHPDLTALLRNNVLRDSSEMLSQVVLPDGEAKLIIRTGCLTEGNEMFFLLDFDYFEEGKLEITNLFERLDRYHNVIYDAFRWCIKDECLDRFNPIQV
jgi:uncharacterized protein (TIGR04255 family)